MRMLKPRIEVMQPKKQRIQDHTPMYNHQWVKVRARFLKENPLCLECYKQGRITPANVVDHITPHKGDERLFWDQSNYQPLCKKCHDTKTAKEDGGFGRVGGISK